MNWGNLIVAVISGLFGGGLLYLAARSKTKADVKVALAKVDADHETGGRSVAINELEASLNRLVEENRQLRADQVADRARIDALEASHSEIRASEQKCQQDLAFLRGKFEALAGAAQGVIHVPVEAAIAAQPTEET